jgi:hypothetical protein
VKEHLFDDEHRQSRTAEVLSMLPTPFFPKIDGSVDKDNQIRRGSAMNIDDSSTSDARSPTFHWSRDRSNNLLSPFFTAPRSTFFDPWFTIGMCQCFTRASFRLASPRLASPSSIDRSTGMFLGDTQRIFDLLSSPFFSVLHRRHVHLHQQVDQRRQDEVDVNDRNAQIHAEESEEEMNGRWRRTFDDDDDDHDDDVE